LLQADKAKRDGNSQFTLRSFSPKLSTWVKDIDLITHPMICASQKCCIYKQVLDELGSNDSINIFVDPDISNDAN
jgi:hypothetical protein